MKIGVLALAAVLVACSHQETKSDSQPSSPSAAASQAARSDDDVLRKYSLAELDSAANVLKVVGDEGIKAPNADKGSEIIGCALSSVRAMSMTMPLKAIMDSTIRSEAESYSQNPKAYSSDHGFESCAASCSCGIWSDVVEAATESSFPVGGDKIHARNKQRLQAKASHQMPADSLACARKASWFCGSDLKSYLEKQAPASAQ